MSCCVSNVGRIFLATASTSSYYVYVVNVQLDGIKRYVVHVHLHVVYTCATFNFKSSDCPLFLSQTIHNNYRTINIAFVHIKQLLLNHRRITLILFNYRSFSLHVCSDVMRKGSLYSTDCSFPALLSRIYQLDVSTHTHTHTRSYTISHHKHTCIYMF